jgi:hypothetical protein
MINETKKEVIEFKTPFLDNEIDFLHWYSKRKQLDDFQTRKLKEFIEIKKILNEANK